MMADAQEPPVSGHANDVAAATDSNRTTHHATDDDNIALEHVVEENLSNQSPARAGVVGGTQLPSPVDPEATDVVQTLPQKKRKPRARLRSVSPSLRESALPQAVPPDNRSKSAPRISLGNLFGAPAMGRTESDASRLISSSAIASAETASVIAFVNQSSGSNDGPEVMELFIQLLGQDCVFDIKADRGPDRGLELHASDRRVEVRALVAGGDGTFSWVANAVDKENYSNVRLVVIPLGSGNDMSRALGWGKKYCGIAHVPDMVQWARDAPAHRMDVWRLDAINAPTAGNSGSMDSDGINHGARPLVCNYLSLGADAHVELQFNQRRWDAPEKYKSRLGNFRAHMVVGAKYIVEEKKICVADHVNTLTVDGNVVNIPHNLQALIFCNIPSYGAGTQPWGFPRATSKEEHGMFVNDGQFEVIGLKSLHHFNRMKMGLPGVHGIRICHGSSMEIKLKTPRTPFQVDGEPWEQLGGTVTLERGNAVGVLPGPYFRLRSRKNAKFSTSRLLQREPSSDHDEYPEETVDDINIGTPRADRGDNEQLGPTLGFARPTASFG